jgi:hypothetical protein
MSARTELDRLAAARPPVLDHTELIVSPSAEEEILRRILSTTRVTSSRRRRAAERRTRRPAIALAAAAGVIAVAGGGALVRSAIAHPSAPVRPTSGHRIASRPALLADEIIAARAANAVDVASRADILYVTMKYATGTTADGIAVMQSWSKGISGREKLFGAGGAMLDDVSAVISHRMRVRRFVNYTSRTWQTDSIAARSYGSGGPPGELIRQLLAPSAAQLRRARGNPLLDDPRRSMTTVSVHGTRMIRVTISYPQPLPTGPAGFSPLLGDTEMLPGAADGNESVLVEQIWLDESTDLPVRAVLTGAGGRVLVAETFTWLSASAANGAALSPAPVPAGFRLTAELAH